MTSDIRYKPSGSDWLGDVPSHWDVVRLKHLGFFKGGAGFPIESQGQTQHELPFFKVKDISGASDAGYMSESDSSVSPEIAKALGARVFPVDTIAFAKVGAALLLNRFRLIGRPACMDNNMMGYILDRNGVSARFVWWMMHRIDFSDVVNPGTVPSLNEPLISNIRAAIPPLDEQIAIASYLDAETRRIDGLIDEKKRLLDSLVELKSTRITEILTGEAEAVQATGDIWLPQIPNGWSLKRLKYLGQVRSGLAKGKKNDAATTTIELPYMRVANVQDGYIDLSDVALIEVAENEVDRYTLKIGDVLMNEGGDYDKLGRGAMWEGLVDKCLHQNHVFAVRLDDVDWAPWVAAVTRTSYAKFYFMNNSKQSTNLASINQTNVKEFPVVLPPISKRDELLDALRSELSRIEDLRQHVENELETLAEFRSATVTDAVLGRIDVSNYMKT